jgi:hypothetical protein
MSGLIVVFLHKISLLEILQINEQATLMLLTARLNAISSLLDADKKEMELYQSQGMSTAGQAFQSNRMSFQAHINELRHVVNEVRSTFDEDPIKSKK